MQLSTPNTNMLVDVCESRLTVHISVHNVRNMDAPIIGKSDPFAILYLDNTGATTRPALPNEQIVTPSATIGVSPDTEHTNNNVDNVMNHNEDTSMSSMSTKPNHHHNHNNLNTNVTVGFKQKSSFPSRDTRWQRIGVTETIRNSHNAVFATSFEIPYFFERAQRIAVDVFDRDVHDPKDDQLHLHDFLGFAELPVPSLVRAKGKRLTAPLKITNKPNLDCGTITIAVEEVSERKQRIHYSLVMDGISKKHGNGPFLTIHRRLAGVEKTSGNIHSNLHHNDPSATTTASQSHSRRQLPRRANTQVTASNDHNNKVKSIDDLWSPVFRSDHGAMPQGKKFVLQELSHNFEKLSRCDFNVPLRFDVSYERGGKHQVVASGTSTLGMAEKNGGNVELTTNGKSCLKSNTGRLTLNNRRISEDTTFLDYIIGGCEISLVIAIDFTASNGDPSQKGSLHFCDSMEPNEYETAIRAVGDILAAYDSDQMFPVFGFGAKLPPTYSHPSHCFTMTEDSITDGPIESAGHFCYTIDGVLNAYRHALYNVRLSGPTVFADIVQAAADHSRSEGRNVDQSYTILLIVTDGVINDVDQTLDALFQASSLPVSVVIIGVGDADFSDMVVLDGDDMGRERDIVQFVNYRQYKNAPEVLRSRVLEEIPRQFLQYMKQRNIEPLPAPGDDDDDDDDDYDGSGVADGRRKTTGAGAMRNVVAYR